MIRGPPKSLKQLHLDLGQRNFGTTRCQQCGMLYTEGEPTDEALHREMHKRALTQPVPSFTFKGWSQERVVADEGPGKGRFIAVLPQDAAAHRKKVKDVVTQIEQSIGLSEGWVLKTYSGAAAKGREPLGITKGRTGQPARASRVFLHVGADKQLISLLVVEESATGFETTLPSITALQVAGANELGNSKCLLGQAKRPKGSGGRTGMATRPSSTSPQTTNSDTGTVLQSTPPSTSGDPRATGSEGSTQLHGRTQLLGGTQEHGGTQLHGGTHGGTKLHGGTQSGVQVRGPVLAEPPAGPTSEAREPTPPASANYSTGVSKPPAGTNSAAEVPTPPANANYSIGVSKPPAGTNSAAEVPNPPANANYSNVVSKQPAGTNSAAEVPTPPASANYSTGVSKPPAGTNSAVGFAKLTAGPGTQSVTSLEADTRKAGTTVSCAVRFLWVVPSKRRKGYASRILDIARCNMIHGYVIPRHKMAFYSFQSEEAVPFLTAFARSQRTILVCAEES
eukprot:gene25461-11120_t